VVSGTAIEIRGLEPRELESAADLSQAVFGFSDRNVVPAWEMFFVTRHGGVALGAFAADRLVGFSYAFPAVEHGAAFLYSNGLAVLPEYRSLGLGLELKRAQRARALELGLDRIRWTANPLGSPILYLSLTRLGASLVEFHPGLVQALIPELALDDVAIEWDLTAPPAPPEPADARLVEIPWDWHALREADPDALHRWRGSVAVAMVALLDAGYRGDRVTLDRRAQRSFVRFTRVPP
jgi:predicted GNAT superfamily acetyltransferase